MAVSALGKVMLDRLEQLLNVLSGISVKPLGILIFVNVVHIRKTPFPIVCILVGMLAVTKKV